jgi:hypothetical protein
LANPPILVVDPHPSGGVLAVVSESRRRRKRDPVLVAAELLVEAIARFLDDWNLHHPQLAGQWGLDPDAPIPLRGTAWLAIESGLDEEFVREIRRGHIKIVELIVFDRLCTAMDCPELIHDRRVNVIYRSSLTDDLMEAL